MHFRFAVSIKDYYLIYKIEATNFSAKKTLIIIDNILIIITPCENILGRVINTYFDGSIAMTNIWS